MEEPAKLSRAEWCIALQAIATWVHDAVALGLATGCSHCPDIARGPSLRPSGIWAWTASTYLAACVVVAAECRG